MFNSDNTPFAVSLSFDGGKDYDPDLDNECNCIKKEAILYCNMVVIYVYVWLVQRIENYYDIIVHPEGGNHATEQMMNCTITPTEKSDLEKIVIMWTRGGAFNKSGPFDPSHFVPLLPSTLTVTSESPLAASISITQSKTLKQTKLSVFATNHIPQRNHCKTETDKKDSTVPAKSIITKQKAPEISTETALIMQGRSTLPEAFPYAVNSL